MKISFLGTNGWYDTETGNTTCVLVESPNCYIVLDAGNGIHKLDRFLMEDKPVFVFLSHFHLDHVIGLHLLTKFNFSHPLTLIGPHGLKRVVKELISEPYTVPYDLLPYPIEIVELGEGKYTVPLNVECRLLKHSTRCMGYRFELNGRRIAFCTDTGLCGNLYKLGKNVDLLITECSNLHGHTCESWPHLNPDDMEVIMAETRARRIALIHFDANNYRTLEDRFAIAKYFPGIKDCIFIARDGLVLEL